MSSGAHRAEAERQGWIDDPSIPVLTERIFLTAEEREAARLPSASADERRAPLDDGNAPAPPCDATAVAGERSGAAQREPSTVAAAAAWAAESGGDPATEVAPRASADMMPVVETAEATPPELTDDLREAVLNHVAERLPEQIAATVRELMQPAIDQAVAKIGEETRVALHASLADLVEQVLREERARRGGAPG